MEALAAHREPPPAPPVYRPEVKKTIQPKAISPKPGLPPAPPVYRPEQKRTAHNEMEVTTGRVLSKSRQFHKRVTTPTDLSAQIKSKLGASSHSPRAFVAQRTQATQAASAHVTAARPYWRDRRVIQKVVKDLAAGGTVDVEELSDTWMSRMFDAKPEVKKVWKRTGSNPVSYSADTFYSEANEKLHPLTADAVNEYWDAQYPGFTRSGNPTPLSNCEDYAKEGKNFRNGLRYDLNQQGDQDNLKTVLDAGKHVLQLGPARENAHFLIAENQGGNVTIRQKDGDSAIYTKVMTATEAVAYIRSKHSTVIALEEVRG